MANFLTKIKAFLYKNPLTDDPNDYIARVESQNPIDIAQLCESAVARGGSDLPAKTLEHALDIVLEEMEFQLCSGLSVNAGTFYVAPHIKGVFHSPFEPFDPAKHHLLCEFTQGVRLRQKLSATEVTIEGVRENIFYVDKIKDLSTGKTDGTVTRGKVTELRGHNIKVVGDDPTCGITLRNTVSGESFFYATDLIAVNDPSRLLVQLPDLPYNVPYELSITTQYASSGTKFLEHPRTATLNILLVEPDISDPANKKPDETPS